MNMPFYGAASITASKRSQIINRQNSDGPGLYDVTKDKCSPSSPKWSLKPRIDYGSCFKITKQNRPPPGLYEISGNMKHKVTLKNPNFRSEKYRTTNQKVAHLSDINLPSSINTKAGSSFGYRDELALFKDNSCSPGPIYHPLKNLQNSREITVKNSCIGFGFGQKNTIYKTNKSFLPGPGTYFEENEEKQRSSQSPSNSNFGKSPRAIESVTNPLGPGEYSPKILNNGSPLLNSSKGFKLKGKLPEASKYINPNGPGSYDLPDTKNTIGPRFNHFRHKSTVSQNELPSPFTYECPRYPEIMDNSKGFSLGKKINCQNDNRASMNPGPGTYEMAENIAAAKLGGYMGRKIVKKKKVVQEDCFGKYDPKMSASARTGAKYSFGTDPKPWNRATKDDTLGPAHYGFTEKRSTESYSMGTSQRFKQLKREREYMSNQKSIMNSTIGFMPSYLKKGKAHQRKDTFVAPS